MGKTVAVVVMVVAGLAVANSQVQFPCNHFLRRFPSMSDFFEHCECRYGNWTEVVPHPNTTAVAVDCSECESGLKIRGCRYQRATGGEMCNSTGCVPCVDKKEEAWACVTDCIYANGSEVELSESEVVVEVPRNQCLSRKAIPWRMYLVALGGYECNNDSICNLCQHKWIDVFVCEPPLEVLLAQVWHLGGRGHDTSSLPRPHYNCWPNCGGSRVLTGRAPICNTVEICADPQHMDIIGRRSTMEDAEKSEETDDLVDPRPLPTDPLPFHHAMHHPRYRRQTLQSPACQNPSSVRHVLFMLDTSGSIGEENFDKMTKSLGNLVGHFCRKIKVAAMAFNHDHYLEFCFDCFDNDCAGRRAAREKMKSIPYRGGLTHAAKATRCTCDNVLQPRCGFDPGPSARACLDVVYITDGKSNDPEMNVCSEVDCVHNTSHTDVNVYVFGIGRRVRESELRCIARQGSVKNAIFKVESFEEFSSAIDRLNDHFNSDSYRSYLFTTEAEGPDCFTSNPSDTDGLGDDNCINSG